MNALTLGIIFRVAYVLFIVLATVDSVHFASAQAIQARLDAAIPSYVTTRDLIDAARNVLLFAGWGLVWVATSARRGNARAVVIGATLSGLAISVGVEAAQLFSPVRTTSVLDVLTNTGGAGLGALAALFATRVFAMGPGRSGLLALPASVFALCYGGAAAAEAFSPLFRQDRVPSAWGPPLDRLRMALVGIDLDPLAHIAVSDIALFLPFGAFATLALVELGSPWRRAAAVAVVVGASLFGAAEFAHGVAGYAIAIGPVLAHALGVAIGAGATAFLATRTASLIQLPARGGTISLRPDDRKLFGDAFFIAYAIVLAGWAWRPFVPEFAPSAILTRFGPDSLIPFRSYLERTDLFTVADASVSFLLMLPMGALLVARPLRTEGMLRGLWPAVWLLLTLESGQLFIAGRWPDMTDVAIGLAALGVGAALLRRAGHFGVVGLAINRSRRTAPSHRPPQARHRRHRDG